MQRKHLMKLNTHFILLKKQQKQKALSKVEMEEHVLPLKSYEKSVR